MTARAQAMALPVEAPLRATMVRLFLAAAFYHAIAVSRGTFDFLAEDGYGMIFNSMLLSLLDGRFDVDPLAVGAEAFLRDGRTYSYFGLFPALVRLPLLPWLDLAQVPVARLSCFVATLLAMAAQMLAVGAALRCGGRLAERLAMPFLLVACLGGPQIYLGSRAIVFHEAILWAWALAAVFVAAAARAVFVHGRLTAGTASVMALAAGTCLNTRVSTALGLYAALGLMMLWHANVTVRRDGWRALAAPVPVVPALLAVAGLVAAGWVNAGRWGDPLDFGDITRQVFLESWPERMAVLSAHGGFSLDRLWFGLGYYLVPVWAVMVDGGFLFADMMRSHYLMVEYPPTSQVLLEPFSFGLAVWGVVLLARWRDRMAWRGGLAAVLGGLMVAPALLMVFSHLAFRYRAEFAPLLLMAGLIVLHTVSGAAAADRSVPRAMPVLWLLAVMQLISAQLHSLFYRVSFFGAVTDVTALGWIETFRRALSAQFGEALPGVW